MDFLFLHPSESAKRNYIKHLVSILICMKLNKEKQWLANNIYIYIYIYIYIKSIPIWQKIYCIHKDTGHDKSESIANKDFEFIIIIITITQKKGLDKREGYVVNTWWWRRRWTTQDSSTLRYSNIFVHQTCLRKLL